MDTTTTTVQTEQWEGNLADAKKYSDHETHLVEAPVFIMFAEYLGYVTRFQKVTENWCDGKVPDPLVQRVLIIEARCMFRQMCKDYGKEKILTYYERLYPIILQDYEDKLSQLFRTNK